MIKEIIQENFPELKSMHFQKENTLWTQRMKNALSRGRVKKRKKEESREGKKKELEQGYTPIKFSDTMIKNAW